MVISWPCWMPPLLLHRTEKLQAAPQGTATAAQACIVQQYTQVGNQVGPGFLSLLLRAVLQGVRKARLFLSNVYTCSCKDKGACWTTCPWVAGFLHSPHALCINAKTAVVVWGMVHHVDAWSHQQEDIIIITFQLCVGPASCCCCCCLLCCTCLFSCCGHRRLILLHTSSCGAALHRQLLAKGS